MTGAGVEVLAWDSDFFGFPIGRVALDGATTATLERIDAEARHLGLVCLYGVLDPVDPVTACVAQEHGHVLVETGVQFTRPAGPLAAPATPSPSVAREATLAEVAGLGPQIDVISPWSRFAVDPRFGREAACRLFRAWLERAAVDDDRTLIVAEDDDGYTGVGTADRIDVPNLDLVGVTKPGRGAAHAVMRRFLAWAGDGPTQAGYCASRNIPIFRFLEKCGFRSASARYTFHRWLD